MARLQGRIAIRPYGTPAASPTPVQKFGRHMAAFLRFLPTRSVEKCGSSSLTAALLNLVFAPLLAQSKVGRAAN